jgi:hypothetical protein
MTRYEGSRLCERGSTRESEVGTKYLCVRQSASQEAVPSIEQGDDNSTYVAI